MLNRREFALLAASLPLLSACQGKSGDAEAPYPSRDITNIIPTAPGGGLDLLARFIGGAMESALPDRVNVIPLNVTAAGGGKGIRQLFNAAPNGYTIGILNIPGIFMLQRMQNLEVDFRKFAWLGAVTLGHNYCVAVRADSPVETWGDLKDLSGKREITFAASGPGSTGYAATVIGTELLGLRARIVTGYKGSIDYAVGAIRGDTDAVIGTTLSIERLEGQLRVIATFDAESNTPGVPGANQLGHPELAQLKGIRAFAAPPDTPPEIVSFLSRALLDAARAPKLLKWAAANGEDISPQSPERTAELVETKREFLARWHLSN